MHASVVADGLHFQYMEATGTISMWFHGKRVPRCKTDEGSRQFFKVGSYFIKTEYHYPEYTSPSQCSEEVRIAQSLEKRDKQYFTELLTYNLEPSGLSWTMFPWYNLRHYNGLRYDVHRLHVQRLCERYGIYDVAPNLNINWFIQKGKPLIVDCGITAGGR